MKRKILVIAGFIIIFFCLNPVFAKKVETKLAEQVALNSYNEKFHNHFPDLKTTQVEITGSYSIAENAKIVYYVFNTSNGGFIIVSADDVVYPVLGYSFESTYSEQNQPPQFIYWMNTYKQQISNAIKSKLSSTAEIDTEWNRLSKPAAEFIAEKGIMDVAPLLTSTWDQGCYYNALCPADANGPCGHVLTGCTATAMSQLMYYHKYPAQGRGSYSYNLINYDTLSADFGATTYDWNGMANALTGPNIPVATLLYHCGVSVNMYYGPNASGAELFNVANSLVTYFKYSSSIQTAYKASYSDTLWENLLKNDLDNNRPILYGGCTTNGLCHSFVCDGYQDTNYFHFNWGWSGSSDGYFYLNNLNAAVGYNFTSDQIAVYNIYPMADYDLWMSDIIYPVSACGMSNAEYIQAAIIYDGSDPTIMAGDTIAVSYRVDGGIIVNDTIILTANLNGGDTLYFTYPTPADFSVIGTHTLDCWVKYKHDVQPLNVNDSIIGFHFENKLHQNFDMGVTKITAPISACHMTPVEPVQVTIRFFGCDSIQAGLPIVLAYRVNNGNPIRDTINIPNTMFPLDTFTHVFTTPANMSFPGIYTIDAWTEYDMDALNTNDTVSGFTVKNPTNIGFDTICFEEANINDLILIETAKYSHAFISVAAHNTGTKGLQMTGGNIMDYLNIIEFPDSTNTWYVNEFLSAKVNFCVDATGWASANMRFDLKQTDGGDLYTYYVGPGDYTKASNLRILVNGVQIGGTYNPTTTHNDPFVTHYINLDAYAGQQFTVTFETRNIAKDTSILGAPFVLDNAYIDNVCFSLVSQQEIIDNNMLQMIDVFPNPFIGSFTVKYDTDVSEDITLTLTDVLGRLVYSDTWNVQMGSNRKIVATNNLPAGVYVLKITGFIKKNVILLTF